MAALTPNEYAVWEGLKVDYPAGTPIRGCILFDAIGRLYPASRRPASAIRRRIIHIFIDAGLIVPVGVNAYTLTDSIPKVGSTAEVVRQRTNDMNGTL